MTGPGFEVTSILAGLALLAGLCAAAVADPVIDPPFPGREGAIRNRIGWDRLHAAAYKDGSDLALDLRGTGLAGKVREICSGPYPFEYGEADYDYARYRYCREGYIEVDKYLQPKYNANGWPDGQCAEAADCPTMTIGYRLVSEDGFYDGRVSIEVASGIVRPITTLIEGPLVNLLRSDEPGTALITFETSDACTGQVELRGIGVFSDAGGTRHAIELTGLQPSREYRYQVRCGAVRSGLYSFRTAPSATDDEEVVFAFASDSREGPAGEEAFMGMNYKTLSRIAADADRRGAQLLVFGGDLVNGYTSDEEDFRTQLKAWKRAVEGFWRKHPIYPAMGNHEALSDLYDDSSDRGIALDKRPYETHSAEAVFAEQFWNPRNGPAATNGRPTYKENVYSFQYGSLFFIAFNNNYWWTTNDRVDDYGGSPEGYMLGDQLDWIERELARAEASSSIKYVFLYAQEPVFPAGGHVKDAMWWQGDNNVKAYEQEGTGVVPAGPGIIETRNRFWGAVARSAKVAAVLTGDEHAYHRMRIDRATPVGVMRDDLDGDGRIDWDGTEPASPNPGFRCPTWQLTAGNAGAPWYAREKTPWEVEVFSSQIGYPLFKATPEGVSMTLYALNGQVIDHVDNLMAIKRGCGPEQ